MSQLETNPKPIQAGETARLLRFSPNVIDVGTIRYDGGPVTVTFVCENISSKAVTILDVHPQCGCTRPVFQREAIAPGATAKVEVVGGALFFCDFCGQLF